LQGGCKKLVERVLQEACCAGVLQMIVKGVLQMNVEMLHLKLKMPQLKLTVHNTATTLQQT